MKSDFYRSNKLSDFYVITIFAVYICCLTFYGTCCIETVLMYEEFNGKLPASRMRACGKGSDRKANATARLLRGNEKSLC